MSGDQFQNRAARNCILLVFLSTAMVAAWPAVVRPNDNSGDQVRVTGGIIEGIRRQDGIRVFKGIPFAEPPVGELRWKAPQPVKPWSGMKETNGWGTSPIQNGIPVLFPGAPNHFGEDCLNLSVWTPAKKLDEKLPVMVWIYGGGFAGGLSAPWGFDGTHLAQKGVVVVSLNYRLGPFGFLAHPDLTKEGGKGNFGLLDQIAALEWVRENITAFGGDPKCVTVFGCATGGISVSLLTVSPQAKGLFHRVINGSGPSFGPPKTAAMGASPLMPTLKSAEKDGEKFLDKLGAKDIAAARRLPASAIETGASDFGWIPVCDGDVLPGDPFVLFAQGQFNDKPLLIGSNSDDAGYFGLLGTSPEDFASFARGFGEFGEKIVAVHPHASYAEASRSAKDLIRNELFAWPAWTWARLQSAKGTSKAFLYYFDDPRAHSPNAVGLGGMVLYVLNNMDQDTSRASPEDVKFADLMSSYWVNFAKKGDPNGPRLPEWSAFMATNPKALVLDASPAMKPVPNLKQLEVLDAYFTGVRKQASAHP